MPALSLLCAAFLLPQGPGSSSTYRVDDPNSHGAVGDAHLSLDEAIRVANGTLAAASLSSAEQARITSSATGSSIVVNAATTPTITLSAPLTALTGGGQGVAIMGMAANGTRPVIDGNGQATVLSLQDHLLSVHGLSFVGGGVAIDAATAMPPSPQTPMLMIMGCDFDGQTVAGVQIRASGTQITRVMLSRATMQNMPVGVRVDDQSVGGRIMAECEFVTFDGVTTGCSASVTGSGADTMFALWRSTFANGETLAESTRAPGSTKLFMYRIVYVDADCSGDVVDCEGTATGVTMVHHHHGDWVAGTGARALYVHPRTSQFDIHGSEMTFHGDIVLAGNTSSPRFWHQNNHFVDCDITYDVDGALPNLLWNRYDNCTISVPATARSPVAIRQSHLVGTDVDSQSFLAPVNLQGCWRQNGTLSGFANETGAIAGPFLGTTEVSPREPQVGTGLRLDADLPFGIGLVWDLAPSDPRPFTSQEPVRFYGDPSQVVVLPTLVLFQNTTIVPIPSTAALVGSEWYVQGISIPLLGGTGAPSYHLPRGERITLR